MRDEFEQLRAGAISFDRFARSTQNDWRLLACYLLRRWSVPPAVSSDDVEQELLFSCWRMIPLYNPERGRTLQDFCVWNAVTNAKGFIHSQRNAYRRRDTSPSRLDVSYNVGAASRVRMNGAGRLWRTASELEAIDFLVSVEPDQENGIRARESVRDAIGRCKTEKARMCVVAFVEAKGDCEAAAEWLYRDTNTRLRCRFSCRADARQAIRTAAQRSVGEEQ